MEEVCRVDGEINKKQNDLAIIEVNHGVERFVFDSIVKDLNETFGDIFIVSNINTDPLVNM